MHPEASEDPFAVFDAWLAEAMATGAPLADRMLLSTVGEDGRPSARMVLYKDRSGPGLQFFTSYESRKARELEGCPWAALVFHWVELTRQIRVEGRVSRLDRPASEAYFATRPRESQLAAWASPQSGPLSSRDELDARYAEVERRFEGADVPCPPHWGGYGLSPDRFEFWQGRERRLHDRWCFSLGDRGWKRVRLGP
jgi:pyridoxamine 5'-phosphate oxidase